MVCLTFPIILKRQSLMLGMAIVLGTCQANHAQTPEPESAEEILHAVREGQTIHQETLDGQLRNDNDGKVFPFRVFSNGELMRYRFTGTPPTVVQMRSTDGGTEFEVSAGGNTDKLTPANFGTKILGTDLTYEELALRFIYWTDLTLIGKETVKTRVVWKILMKPPNHQTQFSKVIIWIDKERLAPLRAEGYDWSDKLISRFDVISAQELNGQWCLKQMRIEDLNPLDSKVISRTYLEVKGVAD